MYQDRFLKIRKITGLNVNEFAEKLGIKARTYSSYERNERQPTNSFIELFCLKLGVNKDWLISGNGDIFLQDIVNKELTRIPALMTPAERALKFPNASKEDIKALQETISKNYSCIDVDFYPNIFASCGNGTVVFSEEKEILSIPPQIIADFSELNKYSCIVARGNSMNPNIQDGDILVVEHISNNNIVNNKVYVFMYNDEIFVKRLEKNIDEISVISDNNDEAYRTRFIKKDDMNNIKIIGCIVGLIRQL